MNLQKIKNQKLMNKSAGPEEYISSLINPERIKEQEEKIEVSKFKTPVSPIASLVEENDKESPAKP